MGGSTVAIRRLRRCDSTAPTRRGAGLDGPIEPIASPTPPRRRWLPVGIAYLAAAGVIWGTIGPAAAAVFERSDLSPLALAWLRTAVAAPVMAAVGLVRLGRDAFRPPPRVLAATAALGIAVFVFQACFLVAVAEIGVTAATLVTVCTLPILVAATSRLLMGERQPGATWVSLALAVVGTALLVLGEPRGLSGGGSVVLGTAMALLTAAVATGYTVGGARLARREDPTRTMAVAFSASLVVVGPLAGPLDVTLDLPVAVWLLVLYLGVVTQGVAYLLFGRGMRTESATTASIVTLIDPLVAAALAWLLFGERLGALGLAGAALLVAALALLTLAAARRT